MDAITKLTVEQCDRILDAVGAPATNEYRELIIAALESSQSQPAEALAVPDMFWDANDGERFGHDPEEIVAECDPGSVIKIDCAKRLESFSVRVLGDGEYEVLAAAPQPAASAEAERKEQS